MFTSIIYKESQGEPAVYTSKGTYRHRNVLQQIVAVTQKLLISYKI